MALTCVDLIKKNLGPLKLFNVLIYVVSNVAICVTFDCFLVFFIHVVLCLFQLLFASLYRHSPTNMEVQRKMKHMGPTVTTV